MKNERNDYFCNTISRCNLFEKAKIFTTLIIHL